MREITTQTNDRERERYLQWILAVAPHRAHKPADGLSSLNHKYMQDSRASATDAKHRRRCTAAIEEVWDPTKHPRLGGPPNAGWFAIKGDAERDQDRSRIAAQTALWHPSVGHHWIPIGVVQIPDIRRLLSDEAIEFAAGHYSGPTNPNHGNTSAGGYSHNQYSNAVKEELRSYLKENRIDKMTAQQMNHFSTIIESGRGANGKTNKIIGAYNQGIKALAKIKTSKPSTLSEVLAAGRKYMKTSRFRALAAGGALAGILGDMVAQRVEVLRVTSRSRQYKRAIQHLENGDISPAFNLLIGDQDSLYTEILTNVGAHAALKFKSDVSKLFATVRDN